MFVYLNNSPVYTPRGDSCVEFYLHMNVSQADHLTSLRVYQVRNDQTLREASLIGHISRTVDTGWENYTMPLGGGSFRLLFEYTMGTAYISDVGLDHIQIVPCHATPKPTLTGNHIFLCFLSK